jgi:hypothetical protein
MAGLSEEINPRRMPRALELENPLIIGYTTGKPAIPVFEAVSPLPEGVYLMNFFVRTGTGLSSKPEYVIRLQNVVEHSADVLVDLASIFPGLRMSSWEETTLALDTVGPRRQWGPTPPAPLVGEHAPGAAAPIVTLSALDMRTFVVRF